MNTPPFHHVKQRSRTSRLALWFIPLIALVAALLPMSTSTAAPAPKPPAATGFSVSLATSGDFGGAAPGVLASAGQGMTLTLTLQPPGAVFSSKTDFALSTALQSGGTANGSLSVAKVTMPAGVTPQDFTVSYSAADNDVVLTAVPTKLNGPTAGFQPASTGPFTILSMLITAAQGDVPTNGFGASDCTATSTSAVCGIVMLPNGISSDQAALGTGLCTAGQNCTPGADIVHFYAGMQGYTKDAPASVVMRCDKSLCAGGAINSYTLKVSFTPTGELVPSLPCVTKGVASDAQGNDYCTDYVQSSRDNAGDTLLVFLFTHDVRMTY